MATVTNHNARGRVVRQSFSNCVRYTASSTVSSYSIDPTTTGLFGVPLRNMAALYQEVRCVGVKLQILPNLAIDVAATPTGALATVVVFGHSPLRGSTPLSFSEVCQLSSCTALSSGQSVKSVLSLKRKDLVGPMPVKWVHFDGSPSTDTDSQGRIWTVASGSESTTYVVTVLVQSTWEFRSPQPFDLFLRIAKQLCLDDDSKEELDCNSLTDGSAVILSGRNSLVDGFVDLQHQDSDSKSTATGSVAPERRVKNSRPTARTLIGVTGPKTSQPGNRRIVKGSDGPSALPPDDFD